MTFIKQVFISYSHKDASTVEDFKRHIKSVGTSFDFWDDTKIVAGQKWKYEIEIAVRKADVAILFLSADFFNSNFIVDCELPAILAKAAKSGTTVISVIVKPFLFSEYPEINQYQAINDPSNSIIEMSEAERERNWMNLLATLKIHYS